MVRFASLRIVLPRSRFEQFGAWNPAGEGKKAVSLALITLCREGPFWPEGRHRAPCRWRGEGGVHVHMASTQRSSPRSNSTVTNCYYYGIVNPATGASGNQGDVDWTRLVTARRVSGPGSPRRGSRRGLRDYCHGPAAPTVLLLVAYSRLHPPSPPGPSSPVWVPIYWRRSRGGCRTWDRPRKSPAPFRPISPGLGSG
jgi:hypothetical protein